ncbi:MAG: hypothetical protein GY938_13100 [Ketobacter sp.]|nr:hypothetical protein [Ketobacter sp.]
MRALEDQETFDQAIALRHAIKYLESLYEVVKEKINDALHEEPLGEYTHKGVTITQKQRPRVSYKGMQDVEELAARLKDLKLQHKKVATIGTITYYEVKYNSPAEEMAWHNESLELLSDMPSIVEAITGLTDD